LVSSVSTDDGTYVEAVLEIPEHIGADVHHGNFVGLFARKMIRG
jgi:hypothetical protein